MHHHRAYEGKIPPALYNTLDLYAGISSFKTSVIIISGFGNAKGGTKVFTHAKPKRHHWADGLIPPGSLSAGFDLVWFFQKDFTIYAS